MASLGDWADKLTRRNGLLAARAVLFSGCGDRVDTFAGLRAMLSPTGTGDAAPAGARGLAQRPRS